MRGTGRGIIQKPFVEGLELSIGYGVSNLSCGDMQAPLTTSSVDVSVFCLSLMGTNYSSYVEEAYRVLKPGFVTSMP